jgi:hypothetical protein
MSEHLCDLELLKKRCAMRQAEGQATVSMSIAGLRELITRLERAEFASRPTVELEPVSNEAIADARMRHGVACLERALSCGTDANGSPI